MAGNPLSDRELLIEHFQADLDFQKVMLEKLEKIDRRLDENSDEYILRKYVPILEAWEGLSFTKKFILGGGAISSALAAIGAAVWFLLSHIKYLK